jgi:flagellar biosynthesis activator protein FlaF
MFTNARKAYEAGNKATDSSRDLESTALFKAARLLQECQDRWDEPGHQERFEHALRYNQRLWTLFQTELARPDHEMIPSLRRDLLQISSYVDKRTFELMAVPDREKLGVLIEIDRNIASGLAVRPAA